LKQVPTLADHFSSPITAPVPAPAPQVRESVERFIQAQQALAQSGNTEKIRTAMIQLSRLYEHEKLNNAERDIMMPALDWLALNVVYARSQHILESPYIVKQGDTLESIAEHFNFPPMLLRKINGLTGIQSPSPGNELKVVVGPFDAKISAKRHELVLLLGGLYAGRFPITLSGRTENLRGEFYISTKSDPVMGRILTLNNGVVIQGTSGNVSPMSISLSEQDIREVFDILGERSVVVFED
jgi:LysM repeat protein